MPIIPIPGGARGYSFLYTHSGGASDDFVVALPKTMPNVNFLATVQPASGPGDFVSCKVIQPDNTTTQIHVVTASPIDDGTQLIVTVNGVASRVMPVVVDGITIGGAGVTGDPLVSLVAPAPVPKSYVFGAGDAWFYSTSTDGELLVSDTLAIAAGRRVIVDGWAALFLTGNMTPKTTDVLLHLYQDNGIKAAKRLATCRASIIYDPTVNGTGANLSGFGSFIADGDPHTYSLVVAYLYGDVDTDVAAVDGLFSGTVWTRGLRLTDTEAV